ncbi:MAG: COR domain-containing protein [Chitinophagales bacterium]
MEERYQEAVDKIEAVANSKATVLHLSSLGLTQLPPELFELRQLKELYIQNNCLTVLSNDICKLTQLQKLDASNNQILLIPKTIAQLTHLTELDLSDNQISSLPREMGQLQHLQRIDLGKNRLTGLPKAIKQLTQLRELYLNSNKLAALHESIGQLKQLEKFYLNGNSINKLPAAIGELNELQLLDVENNKLNTLPTIIGKLQQLQELYLANNQISNLPTEIGSLSRLRVLDLSRNYLSSLPNEMARLKNLKSNLNGAEWNKGLNLKGNRFNVPDEVLGREPASIIQYIQDLQASKKNKPLYEAKLIFIGSGFVGKTSLINMITDGHFNNNETITDGIEIREWQIRRGRDEIKLHIWDFGGQEIMHATHKFFMTSRSAYVLVSNPRAEDKYGDSELEYWLKLIRSYAGNVPIVVVINKCETHKISVPKGEIKDKYPNVVGFVETSCANNVGIGELKRTIRRAITQLKHIDDLLPQSYFDIKARLEEHNEDYIQYNDYERICKEVDPDFNPNSMQTLVNLLHDLGVMLNFSEDRRLRETQVLNPEWVTKGVYQIISSQRLVKKRGILTVREISKLLDPAKYPSERERFYIMDIMERFELAYQMPDVRDTYFIPGAFPIDKPAKLDWTNSSEGHLFFQYHYDVMPSSIMSRFIVKVHPFIRGRDYWRNGVILKKGNCDALVKADPNERIIYIEIMGKSNKRDVLAFIRSQFDIIHERLSQLNVSQKIPVDESGEVVIDYEDLLFLEEIGEEFVAVRELRTKVSVKKLLNGIEAEGVRQENRLQRRAEIKNTDMEIAHVPTDLVERAHQMAIMGEAGDMGQQLPAKTWKEQIWWQLAGIIALLAALAELTGITLKQIWDAIFHAA